MITIVTNMAAALTPFLTGLAKLEEGGALYNTVLQNVARQALESMKTRIHAQGKASDGGAIGAYSQRPLYVAAAQHAKTGTPLGQPAGKTGRTKFAGGKKKGQPHTSRYFAGGYGEYKSATGLSEAGKVNLRLTGQLETGLTLSATGKGYSLGWTGEALDARAAALEKKYGKTIWQLTEEEAEQAKQTAEKLLQDAFS